MCEDALHVRLWSRAVLLACRGYATAGFSVMPGCLRCQREGAMKMRDQNEGQNVQWKNRKEGKRRGKDQGF